MNSARRSHARHVSHALFSFLLPAQFTEHELELVRLGKDYRLRYTTDGLWLGDQQEIGDYHCGCARELGQSRLAALVTGEIGSFNGAVCSFDDRDLCDHLIDLPTSWVPPRRKREQRKRGRT